MFSWCRAFAHFLKLNGGVSVWTARLHRREFAAFPKNKNNKNNNNNNNNKNDKCPGGWARLELTEPFPISYRIVRGSFSCFPLANSTFGLNSPSPFASRWQQAFCYKWLCMSKEKILKQSCAFGLWLLGVAETMFRRVKAFKMSSTLWNLYLKCNNSNTFFPDTNVVKL